MLLGPISQNKALNSPEKSQKETGLVLQPMGEVFEDLF